MKKEKIDTDELTRYSALRILLPVVLLFSMYVNGFSQNISVSTIQHFSFGAFYSGSSGGTVKVSAKGDRTVSGDVIPIHMGHAYFPAIFEIEAPEGTIISIMNGPDAVLQGSNGGSMLLRVGESLPRAPFSTTVAPPGRTSVFIGATLEVGNNATSKPGVYSGSIGIIFNQE